MNVLEIVLAELGLSESTPLIDVDIKRVEQQVKNYCHIDVIPPELNFTIADMVLDLQSARNEENIIIDSVKMGDTSYTMRVDKTVEGIVKSYRDILNSFRRFP